MDIKQLKHEIEAEEQHLAAVKADLTTKEAQIAEKKSRLKELESRQPWQPQEGDMYYYLYSYGDVGSGKFDNSYADSSLWKVGNCFRTKEAAEARRDFLQLLTKHNLWERVQQEVTLRLELEAYAKEMNVCPKGLMKNLYTGYMQSTITNKVREALGDRLNILFQPLTPQDHV